MLFKKVMTTMNEVNRDKNKGTGLIFFSRNVSLVCFTAESNSMSKLIHNRCTCKLIVKTLRLHSCMSETNNCVFVFMF